MGKLSCYDHDPKLQARVCPQSKAPPRNQESQAVSAVKKLGGIRQEKGFNKPPGADIAG